MYLLWKKNILIFLASEKNVNNKEIRLEGWCLREDNRERKFFKAASTSYL